MIQIEHFEQFTVYKSDISSSFLYADFNKLYPLSRTISKM